MDERQVARFLAFGRILIGTTLLVAPGRAGSRWFGPVAHEPEVKLATRALGVRDAILGVGAARAIDTGQPLGPWIQAGAVCDVVDALATVLAFRRIGARRAIPAVLVAGGAAVIGARIAADID